MLRPTRAIDGTGAESVDTECSPCKIGKWPTPRLPPDNSLTVVTFDP
jgi:hypothetical protein